jgi:hypothetical protein
VSAHLFTSQIKRFCAGALEADELSAVADHVADCEACDDLVVEELRRQVGTGPFNFSLDLAFCFRDDHLEFEDLVSLADETLDSELKEIFDIHLATCNRCLEDVRSFLAYRSQEEK